MAINKFLKNPKTGQIVRWNPILEKRTDLMPCPPPWDKQSDKDTPDVHDGYVQVPGAGAMSSDPAKPPIVPGMPDLDDQSQDGDVDLAEKKKEGEELVKEWFGRGVANVTKEHLVEFAVEKQGLPAPEGTKLEMVFQIKEGLEKQGE